MKSVALNAYLLAAAVPLFAAETVWRPVKDTTLNGKAMEELTINGRRYEVFQHGVKPEWGYQAPQQDNFILIHPKKERKNAPLYVVLHSAGHDVLKCREMHPRHRQPRRLPVAG